MTPAQADPVSPYRLRRLYDLRDALRDSGGNPVTTADVRRSARVSQRHETAIRDALFALSRRGFVAVDDRGYGKPRYWTLTEEGRKRIHD